MAGRVASVPLSLEGRLTIRARGKRWRAKKGACLSARYTKEEGSIGVLCQDGAGASTCDPYHEGSLRSWAQWWFQDAQGPRRYLATGFRLENVFFVVREQKSL